MKCICPTLSTFVNSLFDSFFKNLDILKNEIIIAISMFTFIKLIMKIEIKQIVKGRRIVHECTSVHLLSKYPPPKQFPCN